MQDHFEQITRLVSVSTYSISGTLLFNSMVSVLDKHAAAIGVLLGVLTFSVNVVFQFLNYKSIKSR
jgi:uncharacterized protein YejL (UPF0352 family)